MELSLNGGVVAAKPASSATGEEDRISALPDELLLQILHFVDNAADAARTSVLSRRWRCVWTHLPKLRLPFFPEPISFRLALTATQLRLECLDLEGDGATVESLAIWLPAAVRRLSGTLFLVNHAPEGVPLPAMSRELIRERKQGIYEMPCFENAATMFLDLGFLHAFMPLFGEFAHLTIVLLQRIWFDGTCVIGDAGSKMPWICPCLRILRIRDTRGLSDLFIHSESLLELWSNHPCLGSLVELSIEAAVLKKLTVVECFFHCPIHLISQIISANVSAPRLEFLEWNDWMGQCSLKLGQMPHLQSIGNLSYFVYGFQGLNGTANNTACTKLLQPFKAIESLALVLTILKDLSNCQYLMEDVNVLPNPAILYLNVLANGHSFGPSSFHVLRMCTEIKKLVLVLLGNDMAEARTPCLPGCVCDEQSNWKTEELMFINLQEIEIQKLRGSEQEVSFVKQLLKWATSLNRMTVTLSSSTTESDAKELFHMFKSLSKPRVCIDFMYPDKKKVLYAT